MNRLNFDQEKQLIEYFRDNPSLWNTKDKDYNNRMLRTQKLETIANYLQLTRKDVYEKYRNLRTTFFREHKRVSSSTTPRPGDPPDQPALNLYVSKWRHYQNMLFLTKVDRIKLESDGINHNEDSSSIDHLPSSAHGLNNGHDIELVVDAGGGHQKLLAAAAAAASVANSRPQPMDTSELEAASASSNHATQVQNSSSISASSASIVNHHLNSHSGEDLILINASDGSTATVNGGTILTHNGAVSILNSRILSTSSATNRPGSLPPGASIATISSNHNPPSLAPTHSVIFANHHLAANAGASGGASLHRIKTEASAADLHRHLTSPTSQLVVPMPLLPTHTLPPALTALANQTPISFSLNSALSSGAMTSPLQVAAVGAKSNGVTSTSHQNSSSLSNCRSQQLSPVAMQSTPIPASRKSSLLFFTTKDHSPVVSTPTALALDSSSSLEQSVSITAPGSTYVLSNASLVNANSLSAVSGSSTGLFHQATTQLSNSALSTTAAGRSAVPVHSPTASTSNAKTVECAEMRDVIKHVVLEAIVELEDEEMSFCRSLAASLRHMDRSKKEVAKLELQQVIVRLTNPNYCNNTNSPTSHNSTTTVEEDRPGSGSNSVALRSNSNGDHKGNGNSASTNNTVSTIKSGANSSSISDTSATCDKSTNNNKLDNGPIGRTEGDSNGHHHSGKS